MPEFVESEGKLSGNVITNDGYTIPFSKIELKPENVLYLELKTDSDLIKVTVTVEGKKFKLQNDDTYKYRCHVF